MKISNLLSMSMTNKVEPFFKLDWLPANLPTLAVVAIVLSTALVASQIIQSKNPPADKSLAWFVANPKDALVTNKICYDNPQLKSTESCVNSLKALNMMHKGPNS
ncbi:MAG: hypothetical protein IPN42_08690 [Methylococcaceae bacterium]|nr:hypothetical protein [Methylococcaceae bacterium]